MPKLYVKESILIEAQPQKIVSVLSDFNSWQYWSPWLIAEPQAKVEVAPDNKYYYWEGAIVGAGQMWIRAESEKAIAIDLEFLKPFKSKAKVAFFLEPEAGKTKLSWTMDSSLPFFLFWMKKAYEVFISMDYCRGLKMLKDWIELGQVPSMIFVNGIKERPAQNYIGIQRDCATETLEKYMSEDFEILMTFSHKNHADKLNGPPFTMYPIWDVVGKKVRYIACQPVSEIPDDLPSNFTSGVLPATQVHAITHTGPYRHVANAWAVQMMYQQKKIFRPNKKTIPLEIYHNSPKNTSELELISEIQLGAK